MSKTTSFFFYVASFLLLLIITLVTKASLLPFSLSGSFLFALAVLIVTQKNQNALAYHLLFYFFLATGYGMFAWWFLYPDPSPVPFLTLLFFLFSLFLGMARLFSTPFLFLIWLSFLPVAIKNSAVLSGTLLFVFASLVLYKLRFFSPQVWRSHPRPIASFVLFNFFLCILLLFYWGKPWPFQKKALLRQPEVTLLQVKNIHRPRFALEGCTPDVIYVGARDRQGLVRADQETGKIQDSFEGHIAGDGAFLDCQESRIYLPSHAKSKVLAISTPSLNKIAQSYTLPGSWQPMWVALTPDRKYLVAVDDASQLFVLKKKSGELVAKRKFKGLSLGYPAFLNSRTLVFSTTRGIVSYRFLAGKVKILFPWKLYKEMHLKLAYDRKTKKLFGISDVSGRLLVFDVQNRKLEKERRLAPFVRYPAYDPKRKLLFLADHLFGQLFIVAASTLQTQKKLYIGSRSHALYLSPSGSLYAVSNHGVIKITFSKR